MPEPDPPTEATSPRASVSEAWKLWTGYRRLLEERKRLPERGPAYVAAYAADHVAFLLEQKQLLERELREQFGVDVMHPRPRSAGGAAEFGPLSAALQLYAVIDKALDMAVIAVEAATRGARTPPSCCSGRRRVCTSRSQPSSTSAWRSRPGNVRSPER